MKRAILWEVKGFVFLLKNLYKSRKIKNIRRKVYDDITVMGCSINRLGDLEKLQYEMRNGRMFNLWRKILYLFKGKSLLCIAVDDKNELLGFIIYYFHEEDNDNNIIHQAFTGVVESQRGMGIGTVMINHMIAHFKESRIKCITSNSLEDNIASIKTKKKAGFEIVKTLEHEKKKSVKLIRRL